MKPEEEIVKLLSRSGELSARDIARHLGMNRADINALLYGMLGYRVVRDDEHKWRLKYQNDPISSESTEAIKTSESQDVDSQTKTDEGNASIDDESSSIDDVSGEQPLEDEDLISKLDAARRELLDLGLRNTLINYRAQRSKGVEVVDEIPVELYRMLVNEGRAMSFLPMPEKEGEGEEISEVELLFEQPEEDSGPAARHVDNKLQTPYTSNHLQRRLLNTYYAANTFIQEQGINVLYLVLGMLNWYESEHSDIERQAPLVLIPVELDRTSVQARFRLTYSGEDIGDNLSLHAKIKSDFGIQLPEIESQDDLNLVDYFGRVEKAVASLPRWNVDREAVALGFFSFGKLLMFNDLDATKWPDQLTPESNPVLRALLSEGFKEPETRMTHEEHLDKALDPREIHHVMDADSTQMLVLIDIMQGQNLVVQGPPGTGKSQTITNVIAEAIGQGKTVLFVSEKMAALEVVKRRLDQIHLGDACLELHSHKTRKNDVLDELKRTLNLGRPRAEEFEEDLNVLMNVRQQLNTYCEAVNAPIGLSGVTPFQAYGHVLKLQKNGGQNLPQVVGMEDMPDWTLSTFRKRETLLEQLESLIEKMGEPKKHPFWGSQLKVVLPRVQTALVELTSHMANCIGDTLKEGHALADAMNLMRPETPKEFSALCKSARRALEAPSVQGVQLELREWLDQYEDIRRLIDCGTNYYEIHQSYDDVLIPEAWEENVLEIRQRLLAYDRKWWRFLVSDYRKAKNRLFGLCRREIPDDAKARLDLVEGILTANRLRREIHHANEQGRQLFGVQWRGETSNWKTLDKILEWAYEVHREIKQGIVPHGILAYVLNGVNLSGREIKSTEQRLAELQKAFEQLIEIVKLDESIRFKEGETWYDQPFELLSSICKAMGEEAGRVQEVVAYNHRRSVLLEEGCGPFVRIATEWPQAGKRLVDLYRYTWYNHLIARAMREHPVLAAFDGSIQHQAVSKFRMLDTSWIQFNRARLAKAHWENLPRGSAAGQMGVLRREFEKKRRHLPIRQLMMQAGHVIQGIKPVFMMSPMSIATYLPPGSVTFDLVVFDEASQVKPVDAFGAIMRGRQTVVVGDSKQLPPTSFFDSMLDDQESDTTTSDMESILGLFSAQGAPDRMLRWHYRSRHESLIAVSNREFYNNKLVTFPSPDADRVELGLRYHHLPDASYDRGGKRSNRGEAKAIAHAVMEHARNQSDWTLGVAAFSTAQMQEILDQLEIRRRQDPSCEAFFKSHKEEPFFVKNLENVQGDERDVIFISVGYGRDQYGKLSMNFGPLNQEGGERRLNVLITRSRRRCEVFTNLRPEDIDLGRTNARGVHALKRYLQYAATGEIELAIPTGREAESPFEIVVAEALQELGYRVEHQIGAAGFRVDLAIVNPDHPGHYLLGIECDGASYHSARTARDRDRIRQSVLEGLGWRIHRIWSTDWFRNPEKELERVAASIEEARASGLAPIPRNVKTPERHLERDEVKTDEAFENRSAEYTMHEHSEVRAWWGSPELHEFDSAKLGDYFRRIVKTEAPVHEEEASRRILHANGVTRLGTRIRKAMQRGIRYACGQGWIEKRGKFLYIPDQTEYTVRNRLALPNASRKIEFIAPEEIQIAIQEVIENSWGIRREDIPLEVCRMFGFAQTSEQMRVSIDQQVERLFEKGVIRLKGDILVMNEIVK